MVVVACNGGGLRYVAALLTVSESVVAARKGGREGGRSSTASAV